MIGEAKVIKTLMDAQKAFQKAMRQERTSLEEGDRYEFEIYPKEWRISWEKSRRAFELADDIKDRGYYTTSIELCFYAMERAFEAWVMKRKGTRGFRARHGEVFDIAFENGLISRKLVDELQALWTNYRADQYYRPYVPSKNTADKMIMVAKAVIDFIEKRL